MYALFVQKVHKYDEKSDRTNLSNHNKAGKLGKNRLPACVEAYLRTIEDFSAKNELVASLRSVCNVRESRTTCSPQALPGAQQHPKLTPPAFQ